MSWFLLNHSKWLFSAEPILFVLPQPLSLTLRYPKSTAQSRCFKGMVFKVGMIRSSLSSCFEAGSQYGLHDGCEPLILLPSVRKTGMHAPTVLRPAGAALHLSFSMLVHPKASAAAVLDLLSGSSSLCPLMA